jgi:hypothetical protein
MGGFLKTQACKAWENPKVPDGAEKHPVFRRFPKSQR